MWKLTVTPQVLAIQTCSGHKMKSKHVKIAIADILFDLKYEDAIEISEQFQPFIKEQGEKVYHVDFKKVKKLPAITGTVLMNTLEYQVILTTQGMKKVFHDNMDQGKIYAAATYDWTNCCLLYTSPSPRD